MRIESFQSMSSEIAALTELLDETPEEDVIDRRTLLARIEQVKSRLPSQDKVELRERAKAVLTFRGKPVVGTHGIHADFGARATSLFVDAVAAIAASFDAPLKATGPIRDRSENQLLITGTAIGSFGFELEAIAPSKLEFKERTNVELALTRAVTLFQACVNDDKEAVADNIDDLDKRALGKIRDFITTLSDSEATCALSFERNKFNFTNLANVHLAMNRLSNNILTREEDIDGAITGVLPSQRTFEFTRQGGETTVGKIGKEITEPSRLNELLGKKVTIRVSVTEVDGSKPRYVLKMVNDIGTAMLPL